MTVLAVIGVIAAAAGVLTWRHLTERMLEEPLAVTTERALEVPRGTSFRGFIHMLEREGMIEYPILLRILARVDDDVGSLRAGEYALRPDMTLRQLLDDVAEGDVKLHDLTVIEGWNFRDLRNALAEHPAIRLDLDEPSDAELMAAIGRPDEHPEGRFLPETYRFPRGTTGVEVLERAYTAMAEALAAAWEQRADDIPLDTPYEALILASIIEKETGTAEEREAIAGVFSRRLERGMRLQTDPTVIYGMGDAYDGNIRTRDLRTDTISTTNSRAGLPPTPIAMPGRAALEAAMHPAEGSALYFVSRGDGTHKFSDTLQEHNQAVRKYILGAE